MHTRSTISHRPDYARSHDNAGVTDLNAVQPVLDFIEPTPPAARTDHGNGVVSVVMSDHQRHAVEFIERFPIIVGCVAWLTNTAILDALAMRTAVSMVVQKEDFLRPDYQPRDGWRRDLRSRYNRLPQVDVPMVIGIGWNSGGGADSVRCMGLHDPDARRKALPRMHHKFMVGGECRSEDTPNGGFVVHGFTPQAVWTGSFNMSHNATLSRENAIVINNPEVAENYYQEFISVYMLSEPLDWQHAYVAPEFRYGS